MKITIDDKICLKHKLSIEEVLIALAVKYGKNLKETYENLLNREVLVKDDENTYLTQHWNDVLDEIILDSNGAIDDEERLKNLANRMKEVYPKGKMPGTPYYYQCNTREIMLKLKKFFKIYGNYADDDIVEATKRFVSSFNGNYKFLPLIKYFIFKDKLVMDEDGMQHVSPESQLATFLENKDNNDNLVAASDDWLSAVRN
jgi:hypothetical protein